jgi:hypothetical protein
MVHHNGIARNHLLFLVRPWNSGIYLLDIFLAVITPKIEPSNDLLDTDPADEDATPSIGQEFKPFIRWLPEFKFRHSASRAIVMAILATPHGCSRLFLADSAHVFLYSVYDYDETPDSAHD